MSQAISGVIVGDGNIFTSPTTKLDEALSATSINAVQNKAITTELNKKQNILTFDNTPKNGSINPVTSGGIKTAMDALSEKIDASSFDMNNIVPKTAAAHNALCRGKDLTSYEANGGMAAAIKAATFDDIFPGDYIIKSVTIDGKTYSDVKWIIMDLDYHYNRGYGEWKDSEGNTTANYAVHHVVLMPEHYLFNAQMNSSNTTAGGYQACNMFKTIIPKVNAGVLNAFGKAHVLMHDELLTNNMNPNAASSVGAGWTGSAYWDWSGDYDGDTTGRYPWRHDIQCNIPNQAMMYGSSPFASSGFEAGECNKQLAYFRYGQNFDRNNWCWLRDVSSGSYFAYAINDGDAGYADASSSGGVRPYFFYH